MSLKSFIKDRMICVCGIKFSIIKLFNFRIFLKLNFSLIDFFAISLVQPAGGIWDNSLSPKDNQANPKEKKQEEAESQSWTCKWKHQKLREKHQATSFLAK